MKQWLARMFGGKATVTVDQIRKLNLAAAVVLAGQAIAIILFSGTYTLPIYLSYLTSDSLQSKLRGQAVLAPGIHELMQVNLAYVVGAMLLIGAVIFGLMATLVRQRYETWLKKRMQPLRWVIVAVSGGLAVCLLALVAGVQNVDDLKLIAILMIITALGCWQLELQAGQKRISLIAWASLAIALLGALAPGLIILLTLVSSAIFGGASVPSSTWWLFVTVSLGWTLFAVNLHLHRFPVGKWANYLYAECGATVLIVLIETVFAWQIFATLLKP